MCIHIYTVSQRVHFTLGFWISGLINVPMPFPHPPPSTPPHRHKHAHEDFFLHSRHPQFGTNTEFNFRFSCLNICFEILKLPHTKKKRTILWFKLRPLTPPPLNLCLQTLYFRKNTTNMMRNLVMKAQSLLPPPPSFAVTFYPLPPLCISPP